MKRYTADLLSETTGLALVDASLQLMVSGTNTPVSLYATNDTSGPPIQQPVPNGMAFYTPDGRYDLVARGPRGTKRVRELDFFDGVEQNRRLEAVENGEPGALGSLRSDLNSQGGATRVGYDTGTVQGELDAIAMTRATVIYFDEFKLRNPLLSDIGALAAITDFMNANGQINPEYCLGFVVDFPARLHEFQAAASLPALRVSNVIYRATEAASFLVHDGPLFTLGVPFQPVIENIHFESMSALTVYGTDPTPTQAMVKLVNCARVYADNLALKRIRHLFIADVPDACIVSTVYARGCRGVTMPDSNPCHLVNTGTGRLIDIRLLWSEFVPLGAPVNPDIVPKDVSGIVRANPVIVGVLGHGLATGARVRHRGTGTQIDDTDATITVLDANNYSLNGVDGRNFTPYTGSLQSPKGYSVERHLSWQFDSSVLYIEGQYDTAYIIGGVYLHFNRLVYLKASRVMSYLFLGDVDFDLGGTSLVKLETVGNGIIAGIWISPYWTFTYDGWIIDVASTSRPKSIIGLEMDGITIGMAGAGIVSDPAGALSRPKFTNLPVQGVNRIMSAPLFNFPAANDRIVVDKVMQSDPQDNYGGTASRSLVPPKGFTHGNGATDLVLTDNFFRASGVNYEIIPGTGKRNLRGNECYGGGLPEYIIVSHPPVGVSPYILRNNTGGLAQVIITGGVLTLAQLGFAGDTWFDIASGTNTTVLLGRDQPLSITFPAGSAPSLTVLPINL
jgi:hypothetical protein